MRLIPLCGQALDACRSAMAAATSAAYAALVTEHVRIGPSARVRAPAARSSSICFGYGSPFSTKRQRQAMRAEDQMHLIGII